MKEDQHFIDGDMPNSNITNVDYFFVACRESLHTPLKKQVRY